MPNVTIPVNHAAKAVMKDGTLIDRSEVLARLGLNPNTPPDAWLTVANCGSNASALHPGDLQSLVARGIIDQNNLDAHSLQVLQQAGNNP